MANTVFFRLNQNQSIDWYAPESNTGLPQTGSSLAEAAELCQGNKVVVFIPGGMTHLATYMIPARSRQKVLQAVPFAMEDDLIGDIDDFHFAIPTKTPPNNVPVCAIAHSMLENILTRFHEAGIQPQIMLADTLLLSNRDDRWTLLVEDNETSIQTDAYTGFTIDTEELDTYLKISLKEAGDAGPRELSILDFRSTGNELELDPRLATIVNIDHESPAGTVLEFLAQSYKEPIGINLLQGTYAARKSRNQSFRKWYPAIAVLAVILLINVASGIMQYQKLNQEAAYLNKQIESVFRQAMPDVKRMVNPRAQMEQRLKSLLSTGQAGQASFLSLLSRTAGSLQSDKSIQLKGMNFRNARLDIELGISDLQALEKLKQSLGKSGVKIAIQSAAVQGKTVSARIRVQEAE